MTLAQAIEEWLRDISYCRPATIETLTRHAAKWVELWGAERDVSTIDTDAIHAHVTGYRATHAGSTTNQETTYLAWFFAHCQRREWIERNPCDRAPRYPTESREPRTLTAAELLRLLNLAESEIRAILLLAVETGLRRGTILALRWEWFDMGSGWVRIPGQHMKGRRAYSAPLSEAALDALRSIRDHDQGLVFPRSREWLRRRFDQLRRKACLWDVQFHDLRRTFFTRCRERGVPLEVAMRLSDHRDVRTALRHYRSISPEELLKAVGRLADEIRERSSG